jgi:hypothetical protein
MAMSSFVKGQLAYPVAGMTTLTTANLPNHTFGTYWSATAGATSGAVAATTITHDPAANTSTVVIDGGVSGGTAKKGDIVNFAGCNSVNQMNYQDTGYLQDFTVVQDATASGSGTYEITLVVSPCMNAGSLSTTNPDTGATVSLAAYQNVTAVPAENAVVTCRGAASKTYTQDLIFHKSCFSFVQVDIESPYGFAGGKQSHGGFSMTVSKAGDIQNYRSIMRFDTLYGTDVTYPEMGMRVLGAALT